MNDQLNALWKSFLQMNPPRINRSIEELSIQSISNAKNRLKDEVESLQSVLCGK